MTRLRLSAIGLFAATFVFVWSPGVGAQERRPVVFVPGIVGSVLATQEGEVVWGDAASLLARNFHRLDLLPANGEPAKLVASDVLRDVPLIFGAFEVGVYSDLINFLTGETSIIDALSGNSLKGNYEEGDDLFVFAYDWRRSNFANARALDDFIRDRIPRGEYDVIAHSMGGLITRIMLSQSGPNPSCTEAGQAGALSDTDYQRLCTALYGAPPSGDVWPDAALSARREAADRLHTFVELAVPHYGSVNVAATLTEGWGPTSEFLLGGTPAIQNTVLSMVAPVELLPTYENCCARGVPGQAGNVPLTEIDESYWLDLILAFGARPCPYDLCELRRAVFRNGIENRRIIDDIMADGLPANVKANHGIIGRNVKNTREVVYVSHNGAGGGDGLEFRVGAEGDGTVHRLSALLPKPNAGDTQSNEFVVMRSTHVSIVGNIASTTYLYNTLVDPIDRPIEAVSIPRMRFAGGVVEAVGVTVEPRVLGPAQEFGVTLELSDSEGNPFRAEAAQAAEVSVVFQLQDAVDGPQVLAPAPLLLDAERSLLLAGELVYTGVGFSLSDPGIYAMELAWEGEEIASEYVYVVEEQ